MVRLLGCALIIIAGAMDAHLRIATLRQRGRALDAFAAALRRGSAELAANLTPTGELMALLAENPDPYVSRFFRTVRNGLDVRGAPYFADCWQSAIDGCEVLDSTERQALLALENILGQYPVPETCTAIERCAEQFHTAGETLRKDIPAAARLYLGVGLAVSAMAAIVLF